MNIWEDKPKHYLLATFEDGSRQPIACASLTGWATALTEEMRRVDFTEVNGAKVSTVFLGTDHNWTGSGKPVLFETMVFGGRYDQEQERYCTWEEAKAGHSYWVKRVRNQGFLWRIKAAWQAFKHTYTRNYL